jgi:hypothetical protein
MEIKVFRGKWNGGGRKQKRPKLGEVGKATNCLTMMCV